VGALLLAREPLKDVDPTRRAEAICQWLARSGLQALPWTDALRQWQARVMLLHTLEPATWPDVSDAQLLATLRVWLGPLIERVNTQADLQRIDLAGALAALLPWPLPRELERLAPQRIDVPSGSSVEIDYTQSPPVLAVKLQEMFGCAETPRIASGRVPLLIHLLSPARRPLQVTQDLAAFWRNAYAEVRKEMRGRYPRHPWPEDPLAAAPTRHTKRRQALEDSGS
jgi:ATP-dependent helicase HrpB